MPMVTCSRCGEFFPESTAERLDSGHLLCPACQPLYAADEARRRVGGPATTASETSASQGAAASPAAATPRGPDALRPLEASEGKGTIGGQPTAIRPLTPTKEESWWSRTSRELWWLHLLISYFGGLPLVQVLTKAMDPGKIGPEEAVKLADTFVATAPLVIAFGVSLSLFLTYPTPGAAAFSGLIFCVVTWLGNEAALGSGAVTPQPVEGGGPLHATLSYLSGYYEVYGPALFASGLAMGIYGGVKAHATMKEHS
jgi:hypothetical protein